jgi:hypothetical protein
MYQSGETCLPGWGNRIMYQEWRDMLTWLGKQDNVSEWRHQSGDMLTWLGKQDNVSEWRDMLTWLGEQDNVSEWRDMLTWLGKQDNVSRVERHAYLAGETG